MDFILENRTEKTWISVNSDPTRTETRKWTRTRNREIPTCNKYSFMAAYCLSTMHVLWADLWKCRLWPLQKKVRFVGKSAQPNCALFRILFDVCSEFLEDAANSINRSFIVATEPRNLKGQSLPALSIQTDKRRLFCRPAPLTGGYSTEGAISLRRLNFILEQNIPSCFYKEGTVQNAMCIYK